jgi:hypothetical protein
MMIHVNRLTDQYIQLATTNKIQGEPSLTSIRHLAVVSVFVAATSGLAKAHTPDEPRHAEGNPYMETADAPEVQSSWLDQIWTLPLFRFFAPAAVMEEMETHIAVSTPPCLVESLPAIDDPAALAFEENVGTMAIVELDGLVPSAASALTRFERMVTSAGGVVLLTSAYRPAAYQEHLQAVWDKWMVEMRGNHDANCIELKAQAQYEFVRHSLLESQRPVSSSDHTRGIGFDAAVRLPGRARLNRRRVSVDSLARRAGFHRPAIARDPVHFRLIGGA